MCHKYKLDKTSLSGELEAHVNNSGDIPSEYDQQLQFTAKFELQLQKNKVIPNENFSINLLITLLSLLLLPRMLPKGINKWE